MAKTEDAPHVFLRGEGGSVFKLDLPLHETIEERLLKGYLTRVANADGDPYVEGADEVSALPTERPALNASKATWVGWAVHEGMTPDDAEAATKTDLIEKFGATPAKSSEELAAEEATATPTGDGADPAENGAADAAALEAANPVTE